MAISIRTRKILLLLLALHRIKRKKRQIICKKPYTASREDTTTKVTARDTFFDLLSEMRLTDMHSFLEFFRVTPKQFDHLLSLVGSEIFPAMNVNNEAISARDRLALTLRYLVSGDSMKIVSGLFKVSQPTMSKVVYTVCQALWDALSPIHIPSPSRSTWEKVASQMTDLFTFPNCAGAIGGKFLKQVSTEDSKVSNMVTFLAVCDADLKFVAVDIASYLKKKTGISFDSTVIGHALSDENLLDLPPPIHLPGMDEAIPYVFAASRRFPLKRNIMKPYPDVYEDLNQVEFNNRISRCQNLIENAFGVMASRFRILSKPIYLKEPSVLAIAMATASLHNYLLSDDDAARYYCPEGYCDFEAVDGILCEGDWRSGEEVAEMVEASFSASNAIRGEGALVRDNLYSYFCEVDCLRFPAFQLEGDDFDDM